MAINSDVHVGDIGTAFLFTIKDGNNIVDISANTLLQIILDKPDKTQVTKTGSLYTDGTDGILKWTTTLSTDLDIPGWWIAQAYIEIGTNHWHSSTIRFRVLSNL
jgi:hypothetical protein